MKFSLKDLFWSVTLASLGFAALAWAVKFGGCKNPTDIGILLAPVLLSPGPLIGIAIGRLFHRAVLGASVGIVIYALMLAVFMPAAC